MRKQVRTIDCGFNFVSFNDVVFGVENDLICVVYRLTEMIRRNLFEDYCPRRDEYKVGFTVYFKKSANDWREVRSLGFYYKVTVEYLSDRCHCKRK